MSLSQNDKYYKVGFYCYARLMANFEQLSDRLSAALSEVFYADTVDEWMSVNVKPTLTKLSNILSSASKQIAIGGGPKKPSRL